MRDALAPWLPRALQVLDLRRKDRLLLVLPGEVQVARAVAQLVGPQGEITVLEPRRRQAEAIAEALPGAEVLALRPSADDRIGSFDAVLAVPFAAPPLPVEQWSGMVAANLRPGGRFVLDLPAPDPLPDVRSAAQEGQLRFADRLVEGLCGPSAEALVSALHERGLRRIETLLGTHLVAAGSPFDLVDLVATAVRLDEDERSQLGEALARRLHSTAAVETLAHRSAVAGMR